MNLKDNKATFIIIGAIVILLLVIIIPAIIFSNKKDNKTNFPDYEEIEISENDVADVSSETYQKIKFQLENDPYFVKEAMISDFDSSEFTGQNIRSMIWNFIFSYSLNNRKYLTSFDSRKEVFCMRGKNVSKAFKELYNVNIDDQLDYFEGYVEYLSVNGSKYCFKYGEVAKEYSNDIVVGVQSIDVSDSVVSTDLYLYEYYTTYTSQELSYISNLKNNIRSSNFDAANSIVVNNLNGKVTHKLLQFYILNNGDFFKYQILLSKNID